MATAMVTEDELPELLEPLTEEECYLLAILLDRSGVDQAEFLWADHGSADGCYRCYPYQYPWFRLKHERVIDACARDTGKSEGVTERSCAHPFVNRGQEHAITAPEGSHTDRLTTRIEGRVRSVRLLREMVIGGLRGITHDPFHIDWWTGATTYAQLPQRDGKGLKGIHAIWLDVDEAQDMTQAAWNEMPNCVRVELDGSRWVCHGVSKGVQDEFWRKTQPSSGWKVIQITRMHKPTYNPERDRGQLIKEYGGSEFAGEFLRNVYGEHGDTQNRIFILTHLRAAMDQRADSDINNEYYNPTITGDEVAAMLGSKVMLEESSEEATEACLSMLEIPPAHMSNFSGRATFWGGMDVGLVGDPSELVVMAEYIPDKRERNEHRNKNVAIAVPDEGVSRFRLLTRVRMLMIPSPLQADVIMRLIEHYGMKAFSLDSMGNGLPVFQELQKRSGKSRVMTLAPPATDATDDEKAAYEERKRLAADALTVIKGYKFSSKAVVEFNEEKLAELDPNLSIEEQIKQAGIPQELKTFATLTLRELVDERRMLLPNDTEVLDQMNGQTFKWSPEPIDANGKRTASFTKGVFHILDAMRFFALGWRLDTIERLIGEKPKPKRPVLDRFVRV